MNDNRTNKVAAAADIDDTDACSTGKQGAFVEITTDAIIDGIHTLEKTLEQLGVNPPVMHDMRHECLLEIIRPTDNDDIVLILRVKDGNSTVHALYSPAGNAAYIMKSQLGS